MLRRDFSAAIGAEVERFRAGVMSAEEWQRLNPDSLTDTAAMFQRFLDSHSEKTISAGFEKLLNPKVQETLGSSPAPDRGEFEREKAEILKTAPRDKNGKLLAPNGKRSNLSEDQWATVRTKRFLKWFAKNEEGKIVEYFTSEADAEFFRDTFDESIEIEKSENAGFAASTDYLARQARENGRNGVVFVSSVGTGDA